MVLRYCLHLSAAVALALITSVGFNWFTDPYAVFGGPSIAGINAAKPLIATHERIYKMVGFINEPIDALILGTSRAHVGLSPKHPAFGHLRTYNFAMAAEPYAESLLIFKQVSSRNRLQKAVIGLDFFASNAYLPFTNDFSEENFEKGRKWKLLLSIDTLKDGRKTLFQAGNPPLAPNAARITKHKPFNKQALLASESGYMWGGTYLPEPFCRFALAIDPGIKSPIQSETPLDQIRTLIALAHQRRIDLRLFISPSHARQWETLAALGLWEQWEEWKRRLVDINTEEAKRAGQPEFPLWDFSGYNSATTENLPDMNDPNAEMFGYIESSHYKPNIGDWVLNTLYEINDPDSPVPQDFGVKLSTDTIETHLTNVRAARQRYLTEHPNDIEEIAVLARKSKAGSNCKRSRPQLTPAFPPSTRR